MLDQNSSRFDAISEALRDIVLNQWLDALAHDWTAPFKSRKVQTEKALSLAPGVSNARISLKNDLLHIECTVSCEHGPLKYSITLTRAEVVDVIFGAAAVKHPAARFPGPKGATA